MEAPPPSDMYQAPPPPRRSNTAWIWAIVGVIVVCGCGGIGLLGAILFPVFLSAKNAAGKAQCLSNIKRAALAQLMYSADSDDNLPKAAAWIDLTKKYDAYGDFFDCPAIRKKGGQYGYAMNSKLSGKTTSESDRPWETILLFETANVAKNAGGDPKTEPPTNRHGPGRNEAYLDGHAKFIKPPAQAP